VIHTDSLQAFIGYDSDKSQIVLSFRGTDDPLTEWIDNLGIHLLDAMNITIHQLSL
jgi:hypothetical protein